MKEIILATGSPHRKKAFECLDIDFVTESSDVEEYFDGRPDDPNALVSHLAELKAMSIAKNHKQGIIIGFDSVGWFEDRVLEKPKSREEAFGRLKSLSGREHQFYTGIYMIDVGAGKVLSEVVKTDIMMREVSEEEIDKYLDQDPNYNTYALGYDPLGHYSCTFVERIEGSYNNFLRGIPLEKIVQMFWKLKQE